MNIDCLETFLAVARLGSFTRAAGVRHLTQPAVSRQIQRLEEDLGVRLFMPDGRGVRPSAEGELLVVEGSQLLSRIRGMRRALGEVGGLRRGELRLGASSTPGMYMIPGLLAQFRSKYPGIELSYELFNSRAIESMVSRNDLELGFVGEQVGAGDTVSEAFADDKICFVAPPTHRFARRRTVPLDDVLADNHIAREEGSATRRVVERWLTDRGRHWPPFLELGSVEAVKHAVAAGLGIAAVPRIAVAWEVKAGRLAIVRVPKAEITRTLFVVHRKNARLSAAAEAFLTIARGAVGKRKTA